MKWVLQHIEEKKRSFAGRPLFSFVRDSSLDPRERLAFAPCMAPFIMAFSDINRYLLRDDSSDDPLQKIINSHTRVDDDHYRLFLKDLRTLDMHPPVDLATTLETLWSDDCHRTRRLVYTLCNLIDREGPMMRLVILEAVESTGNVGFSAFEAAARDFNARTGKSLVFFGPVHVDLETGHLMGTENAERELDVITLSQQDKAHASGLVDTIFEGFGQMVDECHAYAVARLRG